MRTRQTLDLPSDIGRVEQGRAAPGRHADRDEIDRFAGPRRDRRLDRGQANRAEGKRILADLPRRGRGEGYVWAPRYGLLERVSFPAIGRFDSRGRRSGADARDSGRASAALVRALAIAVAGDAARALRTRTDFVDVDSLAVALGKKPTGGHWHGGFGMLRNNGLIEIAEGPEGRRCRIAELFRPAGR
jgi:hypothetical protein